MKEMGSNYELLEMQWRPLLCKFAGWFIPGFAQSDLLQELRVVLWEAQEKYDSDRGSFKTFLYRACLNHMLDLNKSQRCQKRYPKQPPISLEEVVILPAVEDDLEDIETQEFVTRLSPTAQIVCKNILSDILRKDWGLNSFQKKSALIEIKGAFQQKETL